MRSKEIGRGHSIDNGRGHSIDIGRDGGRGGNGRDAKETGLANADEEEVTVVTAAAVVEERSTSLGVVRDGFSGIFHLLIENRSDCK